MLPEPSSASSSSYDFFCAVAIDWRTTAALFLGLSSDELCLGLNASTSEVEIVTLDALPDAFMGDAQRMGDAVAGSRRRQQAQVQRCKATSDGKMTRESRNRRDSVQAAEI